MLRLIKCEFIKLRHTASIYLLLCLSLIPILMNLCRPLIIKQQYSLFDLYFPVYNQFNLFFPLVIMLLSGTIFYIEYSNGTYIDLITYGFSKLQLIGSKLITTFLISIIFTTTCFTVLSVGTFSLIDINTETFIEMALSFWSYCILAILINIPLGALIINLTRNVVVTTVFSILVMIINAIFMAAPFGYFIPSIFSYRLGLIPLDKNYFFSNMNHALLFGLSISGIIIVLLFLMAIGQFDFKRKIES